MLKTFKNFHSHSRNAFLCRCYSTDKTVPPKENPPQEQPEIVENQEKPKAIPQSYNPKDITKGDMQWRTPWHQREGEYFSALRAMYTEDNQTSVLKFLHSEIDLRPSAIKKWWAKKKEYKQIMMQSYLPERNQMLGNELAAAHFLVYRGGAIKFHGSDKWIKADDSGNYTLPGRFEENKILQALDCSDMNLYYEGLVNMRDLKQVEWLSFNGVDKVDDWYLDRVANLFSHSAVYLDIRNCPNYTFKGLGALWKMTQLKILCIDDMRMTESFEMTSLMLQDVNPHLDIRIGE